MKKYKYVIVNGKRYYDYYTGYSKVIYLQGKLALLNRRMQKLCSIVKRLKREEKKIRKNLKVKFK